MTDHPTALAYATRPAVIRTWLGVCVVVGTLLNLINQGDALFHIGRTGNLSEVEDQMDAITSEIEDHPLFDEDEII